MRHFFICALPRSRTSWLSNWFTRAGTLCLHDAWLGLDTIEKFVARLDAVEALNPGLDALGTACSLNGQHYEAIRRAYPDAAFAYIHRPVEEVIASLDSFGMFTKRSEIKSEMEALEAKYRPVAQAMLQVRADSLDSPDVLADLEAHLLGPYARFDISRFALLDGLYIEPHVQKFMETLDSCRQGTIMP